MILNKQNTTPVQIRLAPLPSAPLFGKPPSTEWQTWFSSVSSWLSGVSDLKKNVLKVGSEELGWVTLSSVGPHVFIEAEIPSADIAEGTIVTGLTVRAENMAALSVSSVNSSNVVVETKRIVIPKGGTDMVFPGLGVLVDGRILISGSYLALRREV